MPDNRVLLAPSLTWRPTTNTSWTLLGVYQKDKTGTTNGFLPREGTLLPSINGYIPRNRFVGDPSNDVYQTETRAISSLFEHSFNDAVKFTQNLRYAHVDGVYRSVYANFYGDPFLDASRRTVSRFASSQAVSNDNFTVDNNIQVKALTGALEHEVLFGVDYRDFFARSSVAPFSADATPFDLYAPVYTSVPLPDLERLANARQNQTGLYAQDQMRLGPWLATIGVRQDYAATRYPGSDSDRSATTGRASLMYETSFGFNPYVVWAQSFNPVWFSPTYGGAGCYEGACKDQRGEIYEVGFKYTPMPGLAINGAPRHGGKEPAVGVTQPEPVEPDRTGPYPRRGNRGHWQGHARSRRDRTAIPTSTPRSNAATTSARVSRACPPTRLRCGANIAWAHSACATSRSAPASATWASPPKRPTPYTIPAYTLFDMMVAYDPGPFRLQLNVNNIGDERYVAACYARGDCYYGLGRTILGTTTYQF